MCSVTDDLSHLPRVLPKDCNVIVKKGSWDMLPIFSILQSKGHVPEAEMYQVFNMGVGMTIIVDADKADAALNFIRNLRHTAWIVGEVVKGKGVAKVV